MKPAERAGVFPPGEEKAARKTHCGFPVHKWGPRALGKDF